MYSLWETAGKWQKCNLVSGDRLCGQQHGLDRIGWIGPAPVQISGCCLGGALSWWCDGLLRGSVCSSLTFRFSWTATLCSLGLGRLRARLLALYCTAAFPLIFLQLCKGPLWSCAELLQRYTLCCNDQCGTVKLRLPRSANCSGVCWAEGMGG